uniref:Cysteine-rich protein 2 n=1 Tax=Eptatretus burgeri TaxID=7764 RepID=A0A8C4QEP4_EPTBU
LKQLCTGCDKTRWMTEKVTSLGKDWHRFCLKCERCNKTLNAGGHAEHDGKPYCNKPCYAALFGPKGNHFIRSLTSIRFCKLMPNTCDGNVSTLPPNLPHAHTGASHVTSFAGEVSLCPGCGKKVYFAEKMMSLGRFWHRPCLRCERCKKTLTAGSHSEHDGKPYCHVPCYGLLFGPKGVNTGAVGCYIYNGEKANGRE